VQKRSFPPMFTLAVEWKEKQREKLKRMKSKSTDWKRK
jgi:hypothetical protein